MRPTVVRDSMSSRRLRQALEGDGPADDGMDRAGRQQFEQVGLDPPAVRHRGRVEARSRDGDEVADVAHGGVVDVGEDHAEQVEVAEAQGPAGHHRHLLGLDAAGEADDEVAPAASEAAQRQHHRLAADPVEADLDAGAGGRVEDARDEVVGAVVDDELGAELLDQRRLLVVADGGDHARAGGDGELHRRGTDAARGRVHEHRLAGGDTAALVQAEVREVERVEERGGLDVVELLRRLERHRRRADDELGVGARARHARSR